MRIGILLRKYLPQSGPRPRHEAMRCPTCGRRVPRGHDACPFCGAFVGNAYLGKAGGGLIIPPAVSKAAPERPKGEFPVESAEPDLQEVQEIKDVPEEKESFPERPATPPPPPPKYAALLRILFPLLFILIPLANLLLRNSPFGADEKPVLQETQFYENVSAGQFSNPQTVFSRSRHERVVLFARWSGSRGSHQYTFQWYTPEGNLLPDTSSVTRFQFGGEADTFSAYALLPLSAELPLGMWRVEVAVDGDIQAQPTFELQE